MVTGEAKDVVMDAIRNVVGSLKIHVNIGLYGQ